MSRPRLLDLFCGAGGCSVGYHRAGFDVVGVDINPQPNYPFEFHQADAMTYPLDGFDAYHGSPPCNDHSALRVTSAVATGRRGGPDRILGRSRSQNSIAWRCFLALRGSPLAVHGSTPATPIGPNSARCSIN